MGLTLVIAKFQTWLTLILDQYHCASLDILIQLINSGSKQHETGTLLYLWKIQVCMVGIARDIGEEPLYEWSFSLIKQVTCGILKIKSIKYEACLITMNLDKLTKRNVFPIQII